MRLIDADALTDDTYILNSWDAPIVRAWLDEQPTVEAIPVVHGQWLDGSGVGRYHNTIYTSIDCSVCEEIFKIESHDREYWKARFNVCPFCGAVMDGGIEDD